MSLLFKKVTPASLKSRIAVVIGSSKNCGLQIYQWELVACLEQLFEFVESVDWKRWRCGRVVHSRPWKDQRQKVDVPVGGW